MFSFDIRDLDETIHGRVRLGIMTFLASTGTADFTTLKAHLQVSDGNLSTHLRKLEEADYILQNKSFAGRRPLTQLSLTEKGRKAYIAYLDAISRLISMTDPKA
ncbi:transcriptional regulator [Acetobacter tropicalis NRIC 0312]|uniref:Transcriptional regulator n=1 Tax=Acetobacter tropicalis TaxID=104102 RepID=A0A511FLH1_9PROT|nr:transcriptional regulator [Acetobacter tropicalis]KXV46461.1 transcriptional regulator [Acetobacter tropicalis]GAL97624.1 transcriptional regulator [Acetobacter tropicalis]GBR71335.1 transcriptional regulator [Acetobacter tropicalis NRIC 0312]GEL50062.1 transcriptional regulator [Acetobacter tropicalis]